jgi:hypothetical protein
MLYLNVLMLFMLISQHVLIQVSQKEVKNAESTADMDVCIG